MASSKKTPHLLLNRWMGSDKPKKDDFNEDNEIIDRACLALDDRITGVEEVTRDLLEGVQGDFGELLEDVRQELEGQVEAAKAGLQGNIGTVQNHLDIHKEDIQCHIRPADRQKWDALAPVLGTYKGNGAAAQKIILGYRPKGGFIFAVGVPGIKVTWSTQACEVWSAFFTQSGCSEGVSLQNDGISIQSTSPGAQGYAIKLNAADVQYIYMIWE